MFPLFETIRIENFVPQNLSYHQERVNRTFYELFPSAIKVHQLTSLLNVPPDLGQGTLRCRFLYNESDWSAGFFKYTPRKVTSLKLIRIDGIAYAFKFTDRQAIDQAFSLKDDADDILIVKDGKITDTSIANILLLKDGKWYTPQRPLLYGTCRARLIAQGLVNEQDITTDNLKEYSHFMLINAMNDFNMKRIQPVESIMG